MAIIQIPQEKRAIEAESKIEKYLAGIGILYERWSSDHPVKADAVQDAVLEAYQKEIEALNARGGYKAADVIQLNPETPGLEAMLAKFNREHWHDEDEVRFTITGHGLFHVRPEEGPVVGIQVEAGDLICLPKGTLHWFDLCSDRQIRTIRLFTDPKGWAPLYSETEMEKNFQPLCLGPKYFPLS